MNKAITMRKIIKIDESKCDGCGICASACHEGAIGIVDGKAKLLSESYCDGLGDCIGECPKGAITFETREAEEYDEAAVKARMAFQEARAGETLPCGCPGSMAREIGAGGSDGSYSDSANSSVAHPLKSMLRNWPVQLKLVPMEAPYLRNADLLIAADCTAFAHGAFHGALMRGKVCLIGCPKLDDVSFYRQKIAGIVAENKVRSIDVAYMEVPCCNGLLAAVRGAVEDAGVRVPVRRVRISLDGEILESEWF